MVEGATQVRAGLLGIDGVNKEVGGESGERERERGGGGREKGGGRGRVRAREEGLRIVERIWLVQ